MKCLDVICGIIIRNRKVLIAQRGIDMSLPLKWEFPGGKRIQEESDYDCLVREIIEELNILVDVKERFAVSRHLYEGFEVCLIAYLAEILEGVEHSLEHERIRWVSKDNLLDLDWADADIPIVQRLVMSNLL